ncbi:MAG: hypothetical protein WEA34_02330 [Gemmatimonadota bacterium]
MKTMTKVSGVFHDRKRVTQAVERLMGKSVPTDEITVTLVDAEGEPKREIPVEDEPGVLHGALMGAGAGAGLGLVAAIAAIGFYIGWSELWSVVGLSWVMRGALIGMVGGVPLGAVIWMGRWRKKDELGDRDLDGGSVVIEVRSDELADLVRRVLEDAGAHRVTTTRD